MSLLFYPIHLNYGITLPLWIFVTIILVVWVGAILGTGWCIRRYK
jgi:hypothetical protein